MKRPAAGMTLAGIALVAVAPALAKDKPEPATSPAIYQAVVDCRALVDSADRLACFDRTVRDMATATTRKDLVVLDRQAMRETRKRLFGFSLPKLRLFGSNDVDERDEVKEIESTVSSIRMADDGFPILTIADGARWKQTDGRNLYPKVGSKIKIKRGALGSYMAAIDGMTGARVMRLGQ